ncbi:MAG TPA: transcriptional repressor [Dehalococcoidia bacterium]|nr:transcriptional repressor [Dehalococcoidia bacterium]
MVRNTKQRKAIISVLKNTNSHPTADWVYHEVRKEIPNISLGTVYRNLKQLNDNGDILELNLSGTLSRFEGRTDNHYHFRCEKCGRIFDLDEPVDEELDRKVAKKTGFRITHHQLEFRGLCQECQQKINESVLEGKEEGQSIEQKG